MHVTPFCQRLSLPPHSPTESAMAACRQAPFNSHSPVFGRASYGKVSVGPVDVGHLADGCRGDTYGILRFARVELQRRVGDHVLENLVRFER